MSSQAGNDIRELSAYLLRHWLILLFGGILGALLILFTFFVLIPPTYTAEVQIRISARVPSKVNNYYSLNLEEINAAKARASTCAEALKEPGLYQSLIGENQLSYTVEQLQKKVDITYKPNTEIVSLKVTADTSSEAELLASQLANTIPSFLNYSLRSGSAKIISPKIIASREERSLLLYFAVGFVGGMAAFAAVLLLAQAAFGLVISRDALTQQYNSPVLAELPRRKPLKHQTVLQCIHILQHCSSHQTNPSVIRIVEIGKPRTRSICYDIALKASETSHVLFIDMNSSPIMPAVTDIEKDNPNLSIHIAPLDKPIHELLKNSKTEFSQILIKDSFRKGFFHTDSLLPSEQIVLVVYRDFSLHTQISRCLEVLHLYQLPFLGFICLS